MPENPKTTVSAHEHSKPADLTRKSKERFDITSTERTDAVNCGIVRGGDRAKAGMRRSGLKRENTAARVLIGARGAASKDGEVADAHGQAHAAILSQKNRHLRTRLADAAVEELDESDELSGISGLHNGVQGIMRTTRNASSLLKSTENEGVASRKGQASNKARTARDKYKAARGANQRIQARRGWLKSRAAQETAGKSAGATRATTRSSAVKTVMSALSSAAPPLSGTLCGVLCFVLAALLISQMASAIFGFWKNEDSMRTVAGLPVYVTTEMVEAALEMQDEYGHPAGSTIAQIICESGQGDHLSGLATQDDNLFGIKWSSNFASCPEVEGKSSWSTNEEENNQTITVMADFTKFKSYRDCIVFRSRVFLQNSRYTENDLIKQAIAERSSDKMAEGLQEAGYATSSDYADNLKSTMSAYNLYRFDSMTLEQFKNSTASGSAIVAAAYSQLGVPYVWGGSTPGVGLDCSGLTQYCYSIVGISIPRYSEDQMSGGRTLPLSEARTGDILWKPGHVAIYVGGDQYIHEPQSGEVCKISTGISYFACAVRY